MSKTFCLTIGDPTGIGPEITVKFLQWFVQTNSPHCLDVVGDMASLTKTAEYLGLPLPSQEHIRYVALGGAGYLPGDMAFQALEHAVVLMQSGDADALITGPLSKDHLQRAGIPFSGHTEILQHLARQYYGGVYQSDMLFLYRNFRMLLLTRHVALKKVSEALTLEQVCHSLSSLVMFLQQQAQIAQPKLCLLGVNPHAGELEGDEEETILLPAMKKIAQTHGVPMAFPKAADGVFRGFDPNQIPYDAYVAAYHDQGLIPFKMVAGMQAVNVTIGLPFLRTSVSHGTAMDIVGKGIADPSSLIEAFNTAVALTGSD